MIYALSPYCFSIIKGLQKNETDEHGSPPGPFFRKIKSFALDTLKRSSKVWIHELVSNLGTMWDTVDAAVAKDGSASYFFPLQKFLFHFLSKSIVGADPSSSSPEISNSGHTMLNKWLYLQLLPAIYVGTYLIKILIHCSLLAIA